MTRLWRILFSFLLSGHLLAQEVREAALIKQIDGVMIKTMSAFKVPGAAIGIIQNGRVIVLKGYGVNAITSSQLVDENTLFKIASNTKAFTSAALAILVDQGKLQWEDKVVQYLPRFQMYDPWVTQQFNIKALLTHRSGLRIGAGDLMFWPEPTLFNSDDIIGNLKFLKPVSSFRDKYAYDNLLYVVAGKLIQAISGQSWEDFVSTHIFKPLNMNRCFSGGVALKQQNNMAAPHAQVNGKLQVLLANKINDRSSLTAPAGGIKCSAGDLLKWLSFQLSGKTLTGEKPQLVSDKQRRLMWRFVTPLPISAELTNIDKTHFRGYALGWRVSDYHGYWRVSHTGTLAGMMSQIIMIPDRQLGIVILTNQQSATARNIIARELLQLFLTIPRIDWLAYYQNKLTTSNKSLSRQPISQIQQIILSHNTQTNRLLGRYRDSWFGEISLRRKGHDVIFSSRKSPRMIGKVYQDASHKWWVKWDDRSFEADAWLEFKQTEDQLMLTMRAISEETDFSFDFRDLNFIHD